MERHYYIYWIEDEFAHHYFGKESILFHLFESLHWTNRTDDELVMLVKQVDYVTKRIPAFHMHQRLMNNLTNIHYTQIGSIYSASLPDGKGTAAFIIKDRYIQMSATGSYEAEAVFFEVLRKISPCFLAMDFGSKKHGWLNPVKVRNFV
ncbi:sporulation inhibitor of replication protein SirA [Bacillus pumilus]|uniref:Sporulation inhibitor of replication protein SirA n=1 Tax=Bacillus pumilus TaxID=1408 RepID=A0AAD0HN33_BACPU|nr:sporulation inhibitor of replication protein SirA [Bacillus pumilus]AVM23974.1 sporulation inhibitor of replication protein SirA [Bacillus pumilus]TYS31189.1 sporulation inhibitor of replication protein SirA [Bacillus pumilus]TYS40685.1 sporulation inhibitor of replication protein SirA [Bacillus pumilus]TYS46155.1 sporulation inhibitor of replication protein SirA [Bacillus pumilus]